MSKHSKRRSPYTKHTITTKTGVVDNNLCETSRDNNRGLLRTTERTLYATNTISAYHTYWFIIATFEDTISKVRKF